MGKCVKISDENSSVNSRIAEAADHNINLQMISNKKRKLYVEHENEYSDIKLLVNSGSPASSRTSGGSKFDDNDGLLANINSLSRSTDLEKADLQSDGFGTEISSSMNGLFSRETTPTSEVCADSEQGLVTSSSTSNMKSLPQERPIRQIPVGKMPSAAELEEFFAAAEKCEQKRFADKYNYDIVKDVPLEGKYQWVRLHP